MNACIVRAPDQWRLVQPETLRAIDQRVNEGAIGIALPHLLPGKYKKKYGGQDLEIAAGKGQWYVTSDFGSARVR